MRFYKLCALLGTLIIVFDIGLSLMRIQSFESIVTEVFESIVKTQMEIDGLQQELNHIDKVLELSAQTKEDGSLKVDDIEYSAYEVERLKNEQSNIRLYTQEKKLDLVGLSGKKKHVMNDVRILFFLSLIFLVVGTLLATFGYLAWYFRIELFEDRRKNPR
ncbi:hypothetical protein MNBD_GAMMA09-898 [hydrothermal vent metagenome]|uniref:Uncharacterized protein n=1 Tax=hydrothermal vent metagenome TaxID=652676 RepID=A0A3B0XJP6_9ZZZZ